MAAQSALFDAAAREAFERDGFARLPGLIPPPVLERLRTFFDPLLVADWVPNKAVADAPQGKVVTNVGRLFAWGDPAPLELLALPEIMDVATAICGDDLFVVQEFAVIKNRGDATPVLWHQDMVHGRSAPCFAMGLYLDDADAGEGALRFVPGISLESGEGHRDENADELEDHECDDPEKAGDYAWILTCRSLRYGLVGNGGHIISVILAG